MKHETEVSEVPAADLKRVLVERATSRWGEKNPQIVSAPAIGGSDSPTVEQPIYEPPSENEALAEFFADTKSSSAYAASCKCGWEANNPLPTKEAAEADAQAHLTAIYGEEA